MQLGKILEKVKHKLEWLAGSRRIEIVAKEKNQYGLNETQRTGPKIIVSLTTYDKRIGSVHMVVKSLLRQSMKPDFVLLFLGVDVALEQIPQQLKELEQYGLQIITGCEDIKPHKKYYFAMKHYPDDIVITVDDDIVYDKNLIRDLMNTYQRHPNAVICRRANVITRGVDGKLLSYEQWPNYQESGEAERFDLLPTGAGGVLYPPHILDEEVFDIESIKKYCLNVDDIWLRYMGAKKHSPVVFCKPRNRYLAVLPETQSSGLYLSNVGECINDKCLRIMEEQYSWSIDCK